MAKKQKRPKSCVFRIAFGDNGEVLERAEMSTHHYYEDEHPLIDEDAYRAARGIRKVICDIYDSAGALSQHFENRYDEAGSYLGGRITESDGTVSEV